MEDQDPKIESGFCPKIMQICCKPGSLEDQDPKSKISKINFASWIRSLCRRVSSCFLKDHGPKTEPGFSPKIMQIRCKPGSLEDKDNKAESGLSSKIMQKHSKLGSLEDQGPKSKISKINFASWIRGCCRHLYTCVSSFFLKDQDPKTESRFSPKIMQIRCKPAGLEDQDSKTESRFSPKIMQIHCKQGGLEDTVKRQTHA